MLYAVSRIPTNNTPLSVYSTHTLYQNTPLISSTTSRLNEVPSRGLHKNPTPGQHRAVGHTRTHPYRIYRAPVRLWRGCSAVLFVFVSCLRLSSRLSLVVCLGDDNASSVVGARETPTPGQHPAVGHTRTHPYRIYRAPVRLWRGCSAVLFVFVSLSRLSLALGLVVCLGGDNASSVVRRNNERARASPPRSSRLSPSRRVCPLSHVKRERGRARSRRSPPRFVWLSLIQLRGPD